MEGTLSLHSSYYQLLFLLIYLLCELCVVLFVLLIGVIVRGVELEGGFLFVCFSEAGLVLVVS